MYVLRNGNVITADRILSGHDVWIEGERIVRVCPTDAQTTPTSEVIDATDRYIMPGMIDIHADYIEHMAAPRPTSMMDFRFALREAERELITHGVTTMFHSLAIYDFTEFVPSPIRSPENTRKLIDLIESSHRSQHIIHHRFHARFEIDNLGRVEELESYIRLGRVHLISFMDHTPGQGQYRNLEIYRKTLKGYRNISDDEVDRIINHSQSRDKLSLEAIQRLTRMAQEHGIAVASHDDDSLEKLDLTKSIGTTISEFPITLDVARKARQLGMHTVAGAPNVLLGGSHSGNLSAAEAVLDGAVDILCSDYYPASLLQALFVLHRDFGQDLARMVRLVTLSPAKAVLIDDVTGSVEEGKRADLLQVELLADGSPVVERAFVSGVPVYSCRYRR